MIGPINSIYAQKNHNSGGVVSEESFKDAQSVTVRLFHDESHPSALHVPFGQPETLVPHDLHAQLSAEIGSAVEEWPRATPVRITGYTFDVIKVLVVRLEKDGVVGQGEAAGVYYLADDVRSMCEQIGSLRARIETGIDRESLQAMLPPGGARNALDCALWDLEAKLSGRPAWQIADLDEPRPLLTVFTCHADEPERMAERARGYTGARAIKLKLTGEPIDVERVRAVRASLPDVWLGVDANQGFNRALLERFMPELIRERVALIEQPFPIGQDGLLKGSGPRSRLPRMRAPRVCPMSPDWSAASML